jgi:hypothetical protein
MASFPEFVAALTVVIVVFLDHLTIVIDSFEVSLNKVASSLYPVELVHAPPPRPTSSTTPSSLAIYAAPLLSTQTPPQICRIPHSFATPSPQIGHGLHCSALPLSQICFAPSPAGGDFRLPVIWLEMFCWRLFDGYSNMHRR